MMFSIVILAMIVVARFVTVREGFPGTSKLHVRDNLYLQWPLYQHSVCNILQMLFAFYFTETDTPKI